MLLEAPLVREAREELRLAAAEPVAVAREELSAEDREARSELAEEETEETTEESEEETLLADEASELLTEAPAEAAEEVSEETTLESELATELAASCVVVVWAATREKAPRRTLAMVATRMLTVCCLVVVTWMFWEWELGVVSGSVGESYAWRKSERWKTLIISLDVVD